MKCRKWLPALLAVLLLTLAMPGLAEEQLWSYDSGNMCLELKGSVSGDVTIPAEVDGYPVNALQSSIFNSNHEITSLTMPDSLRAIQEGAISWMDGLTSVKLNDGLEYIGSTFHNCGALTSLTIPASVRIVDGAINSCESLKAITFEGICPIFLNTDWCFGWLPDDCVIYVPDDQLSAYADALADVNAAANRLQPSGKNAVDARITDTEGWFDFDAATGTITAYREYYAFVEIPATIGGVAVKAIGAEAFHNDYSVYGIVFPEGLERIETAAFRQACNLAWAAFPSTLRVIGEEAFGNANLFDIRWSEGLEEIGSRAFWYVRTSMLELPGTLRTIGDGAFENAWCQELYLGGSVEHIGARAFAGSSLSYMAFDLYSPIDIAPDAFVDTYLEDVDLPWDCSFENRDAYAALLAEQCPDCTVWINNPPSTVAEYPTNTLEITTIEDGVWKAYNGSQPDLTIWTAYDDIDVTALGDGLFKGNQSIRSFYPHHCGWFTTIGAEAFADSSLACVELFGSITTLGDGAFRNCVNLTELTLPASLTTVGSGVLEGCTGLKKVIVLCDPAVLPADMGAVLAGVEELYAAPDATEEQVQQLSALAGYAWYESVARLGESRRQLQVMPYEPLPGDDFWYDEDYARLDSYLGWELNLVLPREIDGVQLTMVGGGMMNRAAAGDNYDVELPVRSLVIPETYTELPLYAFQGCETLETVVCYAPLETLSEGVFSGCTSLREVVFVNGVHQLDRCVFDGCTSLQTVYLGNAVSMNEYSLLNTDGSEAFPQAQCITDPALLPDVDALLEAVRSEPMEAPEPEPEPIVAAPVGEAGAPFLGTWYGISMEMGGDVYALSDFGMTMVLTLNEDGTAALFDGEENDTAAWMVSDGVALIDTMVGTLNEDGNLYLSEDGAGIIFSREAAGDAPVVPETPDAAPVGEAGAPFLGTWYGISMEMGGDVYALSDFGMTMVLTLNEDGTAALFDGEENDTAAWMVSDGVALIDTMVGTLNEDGNLYLSEDGAGIIFSREPAGDAPGAPTMPDAPDVSGVPAGGVATETKYVLATMDSSGYTMTPEMLGGMEYSLVFHEDGTVDFVFAGTPMPGITWSMGTADTADGPAEAAVMNYYGTLLYAVVTAEGLDLDYYGSMLIHFIVEP